MSSSRCSRACPRRDRASDCSMSAAAPATSRAAARASWAYLRRDSIPIRQRCRSRRARRDRASAMSKGAPNDCRFPTAASTRRSASPHCASSPINGRRCARWSVSRASGSCWACSIARACCTCRKDAAADAALIAGAHWHTRRAALELFAGLPVRDVELRSAVFLAGGGAIARAIEPLVPERCALGVFFAVAANVIV